MITKRTKQRAKRVVRIAVGLPVAVALLFVLAPLSLVFRAISIMAVIIDGILAAFNKRIFVIVRVRNVLRSLYWWMWRNVIWLATTRGEPMWTPRVSSHEDR